MTSNLVNLSTGPVGISMQVQKALREPLLSHRSTGFRNLFDETITLFCNSFRVRETYLLTGSGTLANDVMLQEIKCMGGKGLILSNGEFGDRLIMQSHRNKLDFLTYTLEWGKPFNLEEIEKLLIEHSLKWLVCCHCETSTGMVIDVKKVTSMAASHHCLCFIDCMSTVGTMPLDLSGVAMATASSGKGLASIPGLAIVMSNIEPAIKPACPVYLDLNHYKTAGGIPFTILSNQVKALNISARQKMQDEQYQLIGEYRKIFFNLLDDRSLVPFSNEYASVLTIVPPKSMRPKLITYLHKFKHIISYESDYLKNRQWCQLATFSYYTEEQLRHVSNTLNHIGSLISRPN